MKLELITAATVEPLTPDDVKARSRITTSSEDALLVELIVEARQAAENITWSRFLEQTWDAYYDNFAQLSRRLPYPPLSSATTVKYTDVDGVLQTVSADIWEVGDELGIGIVRLKVDQQWPVDIRSHPDSVVVQFVCGYGDPSDVPLSIKAAIVLHVQAAHYHRDEMEVPKAFRQLLAPYNFQSYRPPFWAAS